MGLADDLSRVAELAAAHASGDEVVTGIIAAEANPGGRGYLCAYAEGEERRWLVLDAAGRAVTDRRRVREAVSLAATCEVAAEAAGGGDLEALRNDLAALRMREHPPGIEEAEEAALELERLVGSEPRLATTAFLDAVGAAVHRLESALGEAGASPFAQAMQAGQAAVDVLVVEVERGYKAELV